MANFGRSRNISESSAALQERLDPGSESTGATAGPWVRPHEASGTGPSAGAGAGAEAAAWRPGSQSAGSGTAWGGLVEDQDLGRLYSSGFNLPGTGGRSGRMVKKDGIPT